MALTVSTGNGNALTQHTPEPSTLQTREKGEPSCPLSFLVLGRLIDFVQLQE